MAAFFLLFEAKEVFLQGNGCDKNQLQIKQSKVRNQGFWRQSTTDLLLPPASSSPRSMKFIPFFLLCCHANEDFIFETIPEL